MKPNQIKKLQSIVFKDIFLVLAVNLILLFNQNLLGQEKPKNDTSKDVEAELIKSYSAFKADEASAIIDLLRVEVGKNPISKGLIIVYCGKICQYGEVEAHLRGIRLALQLKSIDTKQFVVISGGFQEKTTTEFWFVPENACPPMPTSSVNFKDVKFKGNFKKQIVDYECCL